MDETCSISGCKSKDVFNYLGKPLCNRCWERFSEKPVDKLREALKMKPLKGKSDVDVSEKERGNPSGSVSQA